MFEEISPHDSPHGALIALVPAPEQPDWQTIFHVSNQIVLYNPTSHALSIQRAAQYPPPVRRPCPYCKQPLPADFDAADLAVEDDDADTLDAETSFRASNYFHLLAIANETSSRPSTPPPISGSSSGSTFSRDVMAEGYFKAFFQEEFRLGMGANGSVYLCQHVLDGNPLGHFAVKKIAVGESHAYLLNILKEVRLLEQLHHPNIITYHHAWLETCQFSSFGPKVPTLHVLMQWAEGGSLDDFIDVRLGRRSPHIHIHPAAHLAGGIPQTPTLDVNDDNVATAPSPDQMSRSARIRAFREFQRAPSAERNKRRQQMAQNGARTTSWTAVHLLSAEEVLGLFRDVTEGLAFLHAKSILHLDLKPGNVLLTWDEGKLVPRAMLSDFGTSRDMLQSSRLRSGNTGTLEYTSPESLPSPQTGLLQPVDSKADMWSLGMILHKLLFFKSPYQYASDGEDLGSKVGEDDKMGRLEHEVLSYPGFKSTQTLAVQFDSRRLPRAFLVLLEGLLHVTPFNRPSCERVVTAIREGKLDPAARSVRRQPSADASTSLVVLTRLPPSPSPLTSPPVAHETDPVAAEQRPSDPDPEPSRRWEQWQETENKGPSLLRLSGPPPEEAAPLSRTRLPAPLLPHPSVLWLRSLKTTGAPHWLIMSVVILLAMMDTWYDGVWISVIFGLLHLAVIRFVGWGSLFCVPVALG
ncbi:kinase-like protein [Mycena amicta]|nr:kinase-like protein [Mycena amicta]